MSFRFEHEEKALVEDARILDGPKATEPGTVGGFFAMNFDKATQLQCEIKIINGHEHVYATLVQRNGKHMPIGAALMRQIRTWFWDDRYHIVYPVPPLIDGEIEIHPYSVILRNEGSPERV